MMRTPTTWLFLMIAGLMLAGCGGSGGSQPSTGVSVSPSGVQVLAGATQQMQATASDGGTEFTWQVNGTTGGNSSVGDISASGLYTAPDRPPAGGKVTITAIEQGGAGSSGTVTLNIGFSNASLSGGYVFSLSGRNQGTPWFAIGEFNANSGQLNNGLEDTNNGVAIQTKNPFTGSYSINPDGSGSLTLGNLEFKLVMQADGSAVLLSSTNGSTLTGSLSVQAPSASTTTDFIAPLVFNLGGQSHNQGFALLGLINKVNNGALSGFEDASGFGSLIRASWSGSYTFDSNNHHGILSIQDSTGSHTYSFYAISATDFALLSTDPVVTAVGAITSQQQVAAYSSSSFNGAYVFLINGNSTTQAFAQAGQFNPDGQGGLGIVTEDINTPGNLQSGVTTTGTYTFDASVNGRGTLTLNAPGSGTAQSYVFYMLSPQRAEFITTQSAFVGSGDIIAQAPGNSFQNSSLDGVYGFALGTQAGVTSLSGAVGTLSLEGQGNLSGQMTQNLNGSVSPTLSLNGTYTLNGSVRGTATLTSNGGGSSPFAIYPLNSGEFLLIGTHAASPYIGIAASQN